MCDSKKCSKCGEVKPLTDFGKRKDSKDGRRVYCKSCQSLSHKTYYEANKERIAEGQKAWHKANKERSAVTKKAWREANKDRIAEADKAYREANKATYFERWRARKQGLLMSIPEGQKGEVNRIWKECPDGYHVDHIYPFSKGGPTSVDNLCYLPASINISKSDRLPEGRILHEMLFKHAIIPAVSIER